MFHFNSQTGLENFDEEYSTENRFWSHIYFAGFGVVSPTGSRRRRHRRLIGVTFSLKYHAHLGYLYLQKKSSVDMTQQSP
jgi:hypothetical protein